MVRMILVGVGEVRHGWGPARMWGTRTLGLFGTRGLGIPRFVIAAEGSLNSLTVAVSAVR